jgi:hypothetical protein
VLPVFSTLDAYLKVMDLLFSKVEWLSGYIVYENGKYWTLVQILSVTSFFQAVILQ